MVKNSNQRMAIHVGFLVLLIVLILYLFSGCGDTSNTTSMMDNSENVSRFKLVEKVGDGKVCDYIYVDTKTGVEYLVHMEDYGTYGKSHWGTVLFDADGYPLLADGYTRTGG